MTFFQKSLPTCHKCSEKISEQLLKALGSDFHPTCFTCEECKKGLSGVPFNVDNENKAYCTNCFIDKFAPRCDVCNKPIIAKEGEKEATRYLAMGRSFHPECFKCEDCSSVLSADGGEAGCYPLNERLLCKNCHMKKLKADKEKQSN
ncbi:LIM domain protein, partial [Ostertagia ostertagi]